MKNAREVFFLIGANGRVLYRDTDESPLALPDRRARWEAIWQHRAELTELCHSHPIGPEAFSHEDVTTMQALDAALGRRLPFSLVTPKGYFTRGARDEVVASPRPPWFEELLVASRALSPDATLRFHLARWLAATPVRPVVELEPLITALRDTRDVVFVCTHNSRRSQLAEAVARAIGQHMGLPHRFFSAGTEATAFATPAREALERAGFDPGALSQHSSKVLGDPSLPKSDFTAVMVCSDADEACPFVKGARHRVRLPFVDPKRSDSQPAAEQARVYDASLDEIARDLAAALRANGNSSAGP